MLYVAYGSNLNVDQMKFRVPGAKPFKVGYIMNWKLDFKGNDGMAYATITPAKGHRVPVVIWRMSDKNELVMDRYEGYPNAYFKRKITVHTDDGKFVGIVYVMVESRRVARPSRRYVNTVRRGYEYFDIDGKYLTDALERNSEDYYMDDLEEVRELKKKVVPVKTTKSINNVPVHTPGKKKSIRDISIWRPDPKFVPSDVMDYMSKEFPYDPYWNPDFYDATGKYRGAR